MFLFKHTDGIPPHPHNPDIKRAVFVKILRQEATINENLEVLSISGSAVLNVNVFHYRVDQNNVMDYRYKGLDVLIEMKADNVETLLVPGIGQMPDFEALAHMLNNEAVHVKSALLSILIYRFTPDEGETVSKLDAKIGY